MALGDRFAGGFLVTLGEYYHLAGLEELEAWQEKEIVLGHLR